MILLSHEPSDYWSQARKLIFRFVCLYFLSYIIFMFFGKAFFESLFAWVGQNVLHSEGRLEYFITGSGDTTMAYISLFVQSICTIISLLLWSLIDRKRPSYNQLFYWFITIIRIFLIFFMISYGFAKVFKSQFPEPSLIRLLQPIGDMSPMGLAWTYMGHSEGFNLFAGSMEVLGGLLLIPRRTLTLGALVSIGVMLQVAMMNFFYDIPVKLFSLHLMAMGLVIFLSDWKRFSQVFIKNQTAQPITHYQVSKDKLYKKIIFWFKIVMTSVLIGFMSYQGYQAERLYGDKKPKPALYGIWETTSFIKNNDTLPPLLTDKNRWRRLIINYKNRATLQLMNDERKNITLKIDSSQTYMTVYEADLKQDMNFSYTRSNDILQIKGVLYGDSLQVDFKAKDLSTFKLINRGYHWINEKPYNR
ncbi:MAG: hypothetical protein ACI9Y7_000513 [Dokdonia sp.]|jgi:hypothetical protein